jgi:hypothetical protein
MAMARRGAIGAEGVKRKRSGCGLRQVASDKQEIMIIRADICGHYELVKK